MSKFKRNERIAAMTQTLVNAPSRVFTLTYFTEIFSASKSTISEDLVIIKETFQKQKLGIIETITGAAGGVKYIPIISKEKKADLIQNLKEELSQPSRRIPGEMIYLADILFDPYYVRPLGAIFAEQFLECPVDYVVTVETKGIPLALKTAQALNVPLVVFRNSFKADDGSTISIHYQSGSDGRLKTMYAPKRAVERGSSVLIIDAFMRGGGTLKGMISLVEELDAKVVGAGVLFDEKTQKDKMVTDYYRIFSVDPGQASHTVTIETDILKG